MSSGVKDHWGDPQKMGGNHLLVTNNTLIVMMTVTIEAWAHGWVCLPGELGELRGGSVSNLSFLAPVTKRTIGPQIFGSLL